MGYNKLNPYEKEVLIRLYRNNPNVKLSVFCAANNISDSAFKSWMKRYDADGILGLCHSRKSSSVLADELVHAEEKLQRELIRTRLEIEQLKRA